MVQILHLCSFLIILFVESWGAVRVHEILIVSVQRPWRKRLGYLIEREASNSRIVERLRRFLCDHASFRLIVPPFVCILALVSGSASNP